MIKRFCLALGVATVSVSAFAQIPKLGNDTLLDVATWNVEWLGESGYGPTDENLQFNNVKTVISQAGFDIIALQEMANANTFFNLSDALFSTYGSINSTFQATQKMCLLYKKSMFELIPDLSKNILNQYANSAFATRPPLQVALRTKENDRMDTLYCIVVHMKAHTGTATEKQDSYNKRKEAAGYLKTYVEQYLAGKKYIIMGDWNDDLNTSLYNNMPTPYAQFLNAGYLFASKQLTDAGKNSWAFGDKMIDHIVMAKSMDSLYIPASSRIFDNAGSYIANFSNNTSDHYPVYAFFDWKRLTTNPKPSLSVGINEPQTSTKVDVYPNPANETIYIEGVADEVTVYSLLGQPCLRVNHPQNPINVSGLPNGVYTVAITVNGNITVSKMIISR